MKKNTLILSLVLLLVASTFTACDSGTMAIRNTMPSDINTEQTVLTTEPISETTTLTEASTTEVNTTRTTLGATTSQRMVVTTTSAPIEKTTVPTTTVQTLPKCPTRYATEYEMSMINTINDYRNSLGLKSFAIDNSLNYLAQIRTAELRIMGETHARPNGKTLHDFFDEYDLAGFHLGENYAVSHSHTTTPTSFLNAWLTSAPHKAAIESTSYDAIGLSVLKASDGYTYVILLFFEY